MFRCYSRHLNQMNKSTSSLAVFRTVLLLLAAQFAHVVVEANGVAVENGYNFTRVSGVSMLPTLKSGDVAVVFEDYPYRSLKVGDVVIVKSENGPNVIHRIIRHYRGSLWITKGDNNRFEDREVLSFSNYAGLALVDESINHYNEYIGKIKLAPDYGIDKNQVALANTGDTIR